MKHLINLSRVAGLALVILLAMPAAQAQNTCTTRTLTSAYGFRLSGSIDGTGNISVIGVHIFDGAGKFVVVAQTTVTAGVVQRNLSSSGTYSLNADCSGTMTTVLADGIVSTLDFVVATNGGSVFTTSTDKGSNLSGELRRI